MSETRPRDVSLGGPEWSRGAPAACESRPLDGEVRKRDAETLDRIEADVRALLSCGWSRSEVRLELNVETQRIDLALSRMTNAERARRTAAVMARNRSAVEPVRVFAIPTPTGGRTYGRLDSNADLVAAVRRRTGLDPWDFEERPA